MIRCAMYAWWLPFLMVAGLTASAPADDASNSMVEAEKLTRLEAIAQSQQEKIELLEQ